MKKFMMALAICSLSIVGACGDDGDDAGGGGGGGGTAAACTAYVAAINGCMTTYAEGMGVDPTLTEDTFCDAYTVDLQQTTDYLNCMTDAYANADCSDVDGFTAASTAVGECTM